MEMVKKPPDSYAALLRGAPFASLIQRPESWKQVLGREHRQSLPSLLKFVSIKATCSLKEKAGRTPKAKVLIK